MIRLDNIVSKLADMSMRAAARLRYDVAELGLPEAAEYVVKAIIEGTALQLAEDDGVSLRCKVCGKGPFTRKGLYLHLKRVHREVVEAMVRSEVEHKLWAIKNLVSV